MRTPRVIPRAINGPAFTPLAKPVQATRSPIKIINMDIAPTALFNLDASMQLNVPATTVKASIAPAISTSITPAFAAYLPAKFDNAVTIPNTISNCVITPFAFSIPLASIPANNLNAPIRI